MLISLEKMKRECSSNQVYDSSWTPKESWKSGVCWNIIPQTWVLSRFWDDLGDLTWISDCTLWLKIKSQQCSLGKDQGTVGSCPLSAQAARFGNLLTKLTGHRDDESKIWYTDQHTKMQEGTEKPDKTGRKIPSEERCLTLSLMRIVCRLCVCCIWVKLTVCLKDLGI